jgi:hypothetical protein
MLNIIWQFKIQITVREALNSQAELLCVALLPCELGQVVTFGKYLSGYNVWQLK